MPAAAATAEKAVQFATLPVGIPAPPMTQTSNPGAGAAPPAPAAKALPLHLPVEPIPWPFPPQPPPGKPADEFAEQPELPQPSALPPQAQPPGKGWPLGKLIPAAAAEWSQAQERILAELLGQMLGRQEWPGSAEILELIRRQLGRPVSPGEALDISSPLGGELPPPQGFWFNVNAELVIHGATEPDAQVTIGGRPIRLRPNGTFSYRFALPDGAYALPLAATSTHGETRQAELEFQRSTRYQGEVGAQPPDPALKPPTAENVG